MRYWPAQSLVEPDWDFERDIFPILKALGLEPYRESLERVLYERWLEPWRYYHGIGHFNDGLKKLWAVAKELSREAQQTLMIAWWFHDAVYFPGFAENEHWSGMLAKAWAADYGSTSLADDLYYLVIATQKHYPVGNSAFGRLANLLMDVDLSRFAADPKLVAEDRELLYLELGSGMERLNFFDKNREFVRDLIKRRGQFFHSSEFVQYNTAADANISAILQGEL